jgi:hypothetical protein
MTAAAAAAVAAPLRRLVTKIHGVRHWLTLERDNTVYLTLDPNQAARVTFTADTGAHAIGLSRYDSTVHWMRPTAAPGDGVLLVAEPATAEPFLWQRVFYTKDPDDPSYWITPAAKAEYSVVPTPGLEPRAMLCFHGAASFLTETLCPCGHCWTAHPTGVCQFCREQEELYTRPPRPCYYDGCGKMTHYGYCSGTCKRADWE